MRIVHCLRAPVGGLFRHVLDLAAAQAADGHDVGLIADSVASNALTEGKLAQLAPHLSLGINRLAMSRQPGLGDWITARRVARYAATLNLDVLHGHGAKGGAYARIAAKQLRRTSPRLRAYYTPHGGTLNFSPNTIQGRVFFAIERYLASLTSGFIFESAFAAGKYDAVIGKPKAPVRIIPNGLAPEDFDPIPLAADATDLLFIGELRPIKGVDVLLQAVAKVRQSHPVTLTVVGSGASDEDLKGLAQDLQLGAAVRFPGALPARQAIAMGRIGVVPSRAESFPYIVLELAAANRPLISTNVGGIPEIVDGTDTALIPADHIDALADAILQLLSAPDVAAARANRLRDNVAAKFTADGMARDVLDFYALTN